MDATNPDSKAYLETPPSFEQGDFNTYAQGEPGEAKAEEVKPMAKGRKPRAEKEVLDYGDFMAFAGNTEWRVEGKKIRIAPYQFVLTQELLDEMIKHKLLDPKEAGNAPKPIESAARPLLFGIMKNNFNFQPSDVHLQTEAGQQVLVMRMDKTDFRIALPDIQTQVGNVVGEHGRRAIEALQSRIDPRYQYQLKRQLSPEEIGQMFADFRNIRTSDLKIIRTIASQGKDFSAEYLKARAVLDKEAAQADDEEQGEPWSEQQAQLLVEAYESVALMVGVPSFRDQILHRALLDRVKNYEPVQERVRKDLVEEVLTVPENYSVERIIADSNRLPVRERNRVPDRILSAAGLSREYHAVREREFKSSSPGNGRKSWAIKEPQNLLRLAVEQALEFLKKRGKDPDYEFPSRRFNVESELERFDGAVPALSAERQPAIVVEEQKGNTFLLLTFAHPQKPHEFKTLHLPLGSGENMLATPPTPENVLKYWQQAARIFADRRNFNPKVNLVDSNDKNPLLEFELGLEKIQLRLEDITGNFDFGRLLVAKVCQEEFVKWNESIANNPQARSGWDSLSPDQQTKIARMTSLLALGGVPSVVEMLVCRNLNKTLGLKRPKRARLVAVVETTQPEVPAKIEAGEAVLKIPEIKPGRADFDFVRELAYSPVEASGDYMSPSALEELVTEKAESLGIQPGAFTLRLLEALDQMTAGQKQILSGAIKNLDLQRKFQRKTKMTSEESLAVLISGLRAVLREISTSEVLLPTQDSLLFAQSLENEPDPEGGFMSTPALRRFCSNQYDNFMANTDPAKPNEYRQKKFVNFWKSFGRQMAERMATSRQLQAPDDHPKLIS